MLIRAQNHVLEGLNNSNESDLVEQSGYGQSLFAREQAVVERAALARRNAQERARRANEEAMVATTPSWGTSIAERNIMQDIADAVNHINIQRNSMPIDADDYNGYNWARERIRYGRNGANNTIVNQRQMPDGEFRYLCGACHAPDIKYGRMEELDSDRFIVMYVCLHCNTVRGWARVDRRDIDDMHSSISRTARLELARIELLKICVINGGVIDRTEARNYVEEPSKIDPVSRFDV
jgi:hypothetical protein